MIEWLHVGRLDGKEVALRFYVAGFARLKLSGH